MKYRKKPVVIDAIQLTWANWNEVCDFVSAECFGGGVYLDNHQKPTEQATEKIGLFINTLEGQMLATENDYIIKGIKGEFYSCKPDIFEATYEPVIGDSRIINATGGAYRLVKPSFGLEKDDQNN